MSTNIVPGQYRKVSVATVDVPLTVDALTAHFTGREVYRHTRFVVVRDQAGKATALVEVAKASSEALFAPVTKVAVLALPHECVYVKAPEVDTGIPSALATVPGNGARCVVVEGRYDHVSFILDPAPVRVRVADVVPPQPAKLVDQASRVLALAEDLLPIELQPVIVDMRDLAANHPPATHYLLPCRASGFRLDGAATLGSVTGAATLGSVTGAAISFLDERPPRQDWTLIGCARSRAIHEWFYGDLPDTIETCPRVLFPAEDGRPLLTKCCLLENDNRTDNHTGASPRVVVPWGASLALVKQALTEARDRGGSGMGARITDSQLYAHLWGTDELRAVFDERARLQSWLDIIAALARAQAKLGIIPAASADQITAAATVDALDLDYVAEETRRTSHSTLGLIHGLQRILPAPAADHVYYGATVQDVTDTWMALAIGAVGGVVWRDLRTVEGLLLDLAEEHCETAMVGRTHGQNGAPITFGFKVASWADEVRRHLDRLREGRPRWLVGQLAGAVGVLGFFGADGPSLRAAFCAELGLGDPLISWLTSRDRVAEFALVLAMLGATLARIGAEVYELQRPEIGELREPTTPDAVGSITMPHKRNPERAEHLDTLNRLVRANAAVLLEGMVSSHERDGRAWKAEWVALPEVCLLTGAALEIAIALLSGLEVDVAAMASKLDGSRAGSEQALAELTAKVGRHQAQELLHQALRPGADHPPTLDEAGVAPAAAPALDGAIAMVDEVVTRGRAARAQEPDSWT